MDRPGGDDLRRLQLRSLALLTCSAVISVRTRVTFGYLALLGMAVTIGFSATGCVGVCDDAKELCQVCEVPEFANCERFDELSSDQCEAEIAGYEANCPDA